MIYETKKAYSEILEILKYMPQEYIEKIPNDMYKMFQEQKAENYKINVKADNPFDKTILSRKTIILMAMLNYLYWCPNKDIKNKLCKQYVSNNEIYQKEKQEKYNANTLFENNIKYNDKTEIVGLLEYKKQSIINRILNKIKNIFKYIDK